MYAGNFSILLQMVGLQLESWMDNFYSFCSYYSTLVSSVNTIKLMEVIEGQNQDKTISVHHIMLSLDQDTIKLLKANTNFTPKQKSD